MFVGYGMRLRSSGTGFKLVGGAPWGEMFDRLGAGPQTAASLYSSPEIQNILVVGTCSWAGRSGPKGPWRPFVRGRPFPPIALPHSLGCCLGLATWSATCLLLPIPLAALVFPSAFQPRPAASRAHAWRPSCLESPFQATSKSWSLVISRYEAHGGRVSTSAYGRRGSWCRALQCSPFCAPRANDHVCGDLRAYRQTCCTPVHCQQQRVRGRPPPPTSGRCRRRARLQTLACIALACTACAASLLRRRRRLSGRRCGTWAPGLASA